MIRTNIYLWGGFTLDKNKKTAIIIISVFLVLLLGFLGGFKFWENYHSAPDYSTGKMVELQGNGKNKLNSYQKKKFIEIARDTIDEKDGPFEWTNFNNVGLNVMKDKEKGVYSIFYKVKPNVSSYRPTITTYVTVKLDSNELKYWELYKIKDYTSDFSDFTDDD